MTISYGFIIKGRFDFYEVILAVDFEGRMKGI